MIKASEIKKLVFTIRNRCRVCYTCVRECPAKAIRIENGQAEVIHSRCIGCGNCTKVCRQGAKIYINLVESVQMLLKSGERVIACVAPAFPADFRDISHTQFVGMLKKLGFYKVTEVAFGADIVALKYKEIFDNPNSSPLITSNCPSIVHYIRQYHPELVKSIAPIVSPMVAMARVVKLKYGDDCHVVFIGPCVAKKAESDDVDVVITFTELRELLYKEKITPDNIEEAEFDPPVGGKGAIFPISRGMVQSVGIPDDIFGGNVVVAEGRVNFQEAIKEFEAGLMQNQNLDLLCCEGCIMGPGIINNGKQYSRRNDVSKYVKDKIRCIDKDRWEYHIKEYRGIDLSRNYSPYDQRLSLPQEAEIQEALIAMGKLRKSDHLDCGACGYESCREHAIAIVSGLAEVEMCLPYSIDKLHNSVKELAISNEKMNSMQQAVKQSEKLARMGQLSAGIAHELNNPLGVVIMYSNILLEETPPDSELAEDLKLIAEQANRCKNIVGGLLNFARKNQVKYHETDVFKLVEQSLSSLIIPRNVEINVIKKAEYQMAALDSEQMIQAITNLVKNGIEAMPTGGEISIEVDGSDDDVCFKVSDSGTGIPPEALDKIFEPFFTTKSIGVGTGLGLATTYGIVKMHKGQITVESNADSSKGKTGTSFILKIPRQKEFSA